MKPLGTFILWLLAAAGGYVTGRMLDMFAPFWALMVITVVTLLGLMVLIVMTILYYAERALLFRAQRKNIDRERAE